MNTNNQVYVVQVRWGERDLWTTWSLYKDKEVAEKALSALKGMSTPDLQQFRVVKGTVIIEDI